MSDSEQYKALVGLLRKFGHDMRVPLNTVISTSDMLAQGLYEPLNPKQEKAVSRIQRNNHRLLAMLDDFITHIKADAGDLVVITAPFDPRALLEACAKVVRPYLEEKRIGLKLTTTDTTPPRLVGDEKLINRMLLALLWNAASFTPEGEINVVSDWAAESGWTVTVWDTGTGISTDDQAHIFEPFWRGEERPQVPTAGAGLGLPLARSLAHLMKGEVHLKKTGATGSTFCLSLPLTISE